MMTPTSELRRTQPSIDYEPMASEVTSPVAVSVVLPAYNEEAAIGEDLAQILATMEATGYRYEVIVVDDGSTDATADIVRQQPNVRLIRHQTNRGTGAARTTGVRAARGEIVVMTDADGTYPNQDMPKLIDAIGPYDMAVGARGREMGTLPWLRAPAKWSIRALASYLTGTRIPDLNSGFRAFKRDVALRFLGILPPTHSWVSTITLAFLSEDYAVTFIPIDYYKRKGRSSFHPIRDTYNYLSLVVRTIMYFNPLKVFLPVTLVLMLVAFGKLIRDIIFYHSFYVPGITITLILTAIQVAAIGLLADLIVKRSRL